MKLRWVLRCTCGVQAGYARARQALMLADLHGHFCPGIVRVDAVRPEGWPGRDAILERVAQ